MLTNAPITRLARGWWRRGPAVTTALLVATGTVTAAAASVSAPGLQLGPPGVAAGPPGLPLAGQLGMRPACAQAPPGYAACLAIVDTILHWQGHAWTAGPAPAHQPATAPPASSSASAPFTPYMAADLQFAYQLPSSLLGAKKTIAIVDAFDDPNAAADLAVYRAANHLPACDAHFPCFAKVNQHGKQGSYPPADPDWAAEESLDVDMASAICPNCKIILVEANDDSLASLAAAEDEAAKLGANVISNSYGGSELPGDLTSLAPHYNHRGVVVTASSGDFGLGIFVPAVFSTVIAVGGTELYRQAGTARGWGEKVWPGSGSGCSVNVPKPRWQHDSLCNHRTVADVAAVADPGTPVAIYDTFDETPPGWLAVGGTSVGSPLIAGVYALAGNTAKITAGAWLYSHRTALYDITYQPGLAELSPQSNGDCGGSYICTPARGYDGPTGLGTPHGIGAF
jgi:hypothetical protein